ncbi:MAG: hypothetical protein MMC33_005399 [Icmadophila ericetorum]|nr:hypothetical protein [Icmadophila ericetorum]
MALGTGQLYDDLEDLGLHCGPTFQALKNVSFNVEGEATAAINVHEWKNKTSQPTLQPYLIHPTALDGVLQLMFPALTNAMMTKLLSANAVFQGLSEAKCDYIALHPTKSKPCIVIQNCEATAVASRENLSTSQFSLKQLCWNIDWKPGVDQMSGQGIIAYCAYASQTTRSSNEEMIPDKESVCFIAISKALGEPSNESALSAKPHLLRYIQWMEHQLCKYNNGTLSFGQPQWRELIHDQDYQDKLFQRVENSGPEGQLIVKVGRHLGDILRGRVEPLELLFKGNLMDEYYAANGRDLFKKLARYVDLLAFKNPALKILEIGAGTGGTTKTILYTLVQHGEEEPGAPRCSEYVFTDNPPSFFEKARELFKGYSDRATFTTLDIERDPLQQGYEVKKYDVIVAANVLHATASLTNTLRNSRKLLKPGGKLLLYEICNPEPMRQELLSESQFSGVDLAILDYDDDINHLCSAMIFTATDTEPSTLRFSNITLVTVPNSSLQSAIAQSLKDSLEMTTSIECDIALLSEVYALDLQHTTCISLIEIEKSFIHNMAKDDYSNLQRLVSSTQRLLWVVNRGYRSSPVGPATAMFTGLSRSIHGDNGNLRAVTLSLHNPEVVPQAVETIVKILESTLFSTSDTIETEFEKQDEKLCVGRLIEGNYLNSHINSKTVPKQPVITRLGQDLGRQLSLRIRSPGVLNSFEFVDDKEYLQPLAPDEVEIVVRVSGLNFKDILIALGQVSDNHIGQECAGIVARVGADVSFRVGDRVVSWEGGSLKTYCWSKGIKTMKTPDDLSFSIAASLPIAYCTAYYSLIHVARARSGESVLVHFGAGGTGQAILQLATHIGLEIYVTVGTKEKKKLIMDLNHIQEDYIFSSRTLSFAQGIKRMT